MPKVGSKKKSEKVRWYVNDMPMEERLKMKSNDMLTFSEFWKRLYRAQKVEEPKQ